MKRLIHGESKCTVSKSRISFHLEIFRKRWKNKCELNVKDGRVISADLFDADIDESRKVDNGRGKIQKGYSYYDFDVEEDIQEIVSWADGDPSWWDNWQEFGIWDSIFGDIPEEEGRSFSPIYIPKDEDFAGTAENIADRLMCQVSDVESIREAYQIDGQVLVMFRFAVSDYLSQTGYVDINWTSDYESGLFYESDAFALGKIYKMPTFNFVGVGENEVDGTTFNARVSTTSRT